MKPIDEIKKALSACAAYGICIAQDALEVIENLEERIAIMQEGMKDE